MYNLKSLPYFILIQSSAQSAFTARWSEWQMQPEAFPQYTFIGDHSVKWCASDFFKSGVAEVSHTNTVFFLSTEFTQSPVITYCWVSWSRYNGGMWSSVVTAAAASQITVYSQLFTRLCWCKINPSNFT